MTRTIEYTDSFIPAKPSEVIAEVYHDSIHNELFVRLHSGSICGYSGVSGYMFLEFKKAESAGKFWNTHIRWSHAGLNGDVTLVPYDEGEAAVADKSSLDTGNKAFSVVVSVKGDLKFDLDAEDVVAATQKVYELIEKSVVDGVYFVKEVKVNN